MMHRHPVVDPPDFSRSRASFVVSIRLIPDAAERWTAIVPVVAIPGGCPR